MKARDAVRDAGTRLASAGVDSARRSARLLLAKAMGIGTTDLPSEGTDLEYDAEVKLDEYVERRIAHEPLAYILGHKEFWSLDFLVGRGVLIPRPETETLIEEMLKEFPTRSRALDILDFGTGSGCLIVAALSLFPNASGMGIDNSVRAMRWARKNINRLGVESRCELRHQDWSDEIGFRFDVILANPPYIRHSAKAALPPDVERYEPASALIGGEDGLQPFRNLAPRIAKCLKSDGVAFVEIGEGQGERAQEILATAGLETRRVVPDLVGIPRCIVARLPG
jgi:release factor glutamine methyltransferase